MNEFMHFIVPLLGMLLLTSQTRSVENNGPGVNEFRKALLVSAKNSVSKRTSKLDDVKFFEGISECSPNITTEKAQSAVKRKSLNITGNDDKNFDELKTLLMKLLDKIGSIEKNSKRDADVDQELTRVNSQPMITELDRADLIETATGQAHSYNSVSRKRKVKDRIKKEKKQRWGKWTNWSPCSVSCGKGREIRWRHCLENCEIAETEMEEKTCQLPACGPAKLFGVIKL